MSLSLLTAVTGPASGVAISTSTPQHRTVVGLGLEADGRVHSHCAHSGGHQPGHEGLGRAPVLTSPGLCTDFRVWGWLLEEGLPVLPASQGTKATKSPPRGPLLGTSGDTNRHCVTADGACTQVLLGHTGTHTDGDDAVPKASWCWELGPRTCARAALLPGSPGTCVPGRTEAGEAQPWPWRARWAGGRCGAA